MFKPDYLMCRSRALDRALQATWKVLHDEQTGLSATIEQKVSPHMPFCDQTGHEAPAFLHSCLMTLCAISLLNVAGWGRGQSTQLVSDVAAAQVHEALCAIYEQRAE